MEVEQKPHHTRCIVEATKTCLHKVRCGSSQESKYQSAADLGLSGCEELFVVRPILFNWVCLLTSPAVVNCIKAVSGSMATFYNSYFNRGEE